MDIGRQTSGERVRHRRRDAPALPALPRRLLARPALLVRHEIQDGVALTRQLGIEVDQLGHTGREPVRCPGNHRSAVAVTDQHDLAQILELDDPDHVPDVRLQVHLRARQVRPLAQTAVLTLYGGLLVLVGAAALLGVLGSPPANATALR